MAENFARFVEMTVKKELLNIEDSQNITQRMTTVIWRISAKQTIPLHSEFAKEERNEDANLTFIEVIKFKSVNYFESITKQLLDSAFV